MVSGVVVFNEIVVLPIFGFDRNTKEKLALKKAAKADQDNEYQLNYQN